MDGLVMSLLDCMDNTNSSRSQRQKKLPNQRMSRGKFRSDLEIFFRSYRVTNSQ